MINYEFVKEVLYDDAHPELTPSTFPEVHTVRGEKLPTIGQIQVIFLLNGRQFTSQFHIITNMAYQVILGRDFLQFNGEIINFSEGTLKLEKRPTRLRRPYEKKIQPALLLEAMTLINS